MVFTVVMGLALALGATLSAAQAAPLGALKKFRVPTPGSDPWGTTLGSDGTLWFSRSLMLTALQSETTY